MFPVSWIFNVVKTDVNSDLQISVSPVSQNNIYSLSCSLYIYPFIAKEPTYVRNAIHCSLIFL
jgi:hypothetical protein